MAWEKDCLGQLQDCFSQFLEYFRVLYQLLFVSPLILFAVNTLRTRITFDLQDTSSLACTFVSTDATMFHRHLIGIFRDVSYEWGTRIIGEQRTCRVSSKGYFRILAGFTSHLKEIDVGIGKVSLFHVIRNNRIQLLFFGNFVSWL